MRGAVAVSTSVIGLLLFSGARQCGLQTDNLADHVGVCSQNL